MPYDSSKRRGKGLDVLRQKLAEKSRLNPKTGCLEWAGSKISGGYGKLRFNGRLDSTHRWSCRAWHGEIPEGMRVLHRCDNPPCINPDHLFTGTAKDNTQDGLTKGRIIGAGKKAARGEHAAKAKLTADKVLKIRERAARGELQTDLSEVYGVTQASISAIVLRKTWAHV